MRTPKFNIKIAGRDVSKFVNSLVVEETIAKDSYIKIVLKSPDVIALVDDHILEREKVVEVQFGFATQPLSAIYRVLIKEISVDYAKDLTVTIKCLDKGSRIRVTESNKVYNGRVDKILRQIADKYGLDLSLDKTIEYKDIGQIPQAYLSDWELLRTVCKLQGGCDFYIDSDTLFFVKRDKAIGATHQYTYGVDVHSLTVALKSPTKKKEDENVIGSSVALSDKSIEAIIRAEQEEADRRAAAMIGMLNINQQYIDWTGKKIPNPNYVAPITKEEIEKQNKRNALNIDLNVYWKAHSGKELTGFFKDEKIRERVTDAFGPDALERYTVGFDLSRDDEVKVYMKELPPRHIGSGKSDGGGDGDKKIFELMIALELNSKFRLNDKIELRGVAARHSGLWRITNIEHNISERDAITKIFCQRKPTAIDWVEESDSEPTNKVTPDSNDKEAKVMRLDADGQVYWKSNAADGKEIINKAQGKNIRNGLDSVNK